MDWLTLLTVTGVLYVIVSVIFSLILTRFFYKEYKDSKKHHAKHIEKMDEMKKEFDERQKKIKDRMNRFK